MLQQDTITSATHTSVADTVRHVRALTPADVIEALPADATPEQQDSAVQAAFSPGEIHYSSRPDTLHLPGHEEVVNPYDSDLERLYAGGFFSGDTTMHCELGVWHGGVVGDPVPYTLGADNMMTALLLGCVLLVVVALSRSRRFIVRQTKDLVYAAHSAAETITETGTEVRFQLFLIMQTCLQLAIFQYFYTIHYIGDTFILHSQYHLIAIYFAMFAGCFIVKGLLYTFVNMVFFGARRNLQWLKALLFIASSEGIALLPAILLLVYFNLRIQNVTIYVAVVLILVKILTLYKCYFIFFRRIGAFLQIILYFCALEIVPVVALWGAMVITGNHLIINF